MNKQVLLSQIIAAKIKQRRQNSPLIWYLVISFSFLFGIALLPFVALPGYLLMQFDSILSVLLGATLFCVVGFTSAFTSLWFISSENIHYLTSVLGIKTTKRSLFLVILKYSMVCHISVFGVMVKVSLLDNPLNTLVYLTVAYALLFFCAYLSIKIRCKLPLWPL